ncbi:MobF family relaxase [Ilumatobacter nonamiensis]|uniref:MobF family relaxase n=1 Tax=Ilumatobacter nonamiensis TaxID=467093 RepID=UPI0003485DDD|nr:MobF family relaxase [Ilumatobacter nonamiensis]
MLSITKLRVGQEAYQLSGVAQSLDDYYTGAGEAHGQWLGGGAERLGLDGQVDPDDLRAVLAGLRPGTGGLTPNGHEIKPHPNRVPGFDLTFKAPKSASVLYAVSDDPSVQGAIIEAGENALRSAIGWLEREAVQVQRGSHNTKYLERLSPEERAAAGPKRLSTTGLVAAAFRHRTSRAGDPLLHWHTLAANLVEGADGQWSAFAHPEIYRHARAAGEVFQTAFRAELTRSLGIEWRPGKTVPEIAGIPQSLLDSFSKRSTEIEAWLAATGTPNTIEGRQAAVLATRRRKPEVEHERFDVAWKEEASAAGWGPQFADGLVAAASDRRPVDFGEAWRLETETIDENGQIDRFERTVTPEEWISDLLRRDLTSDRSTFALPDLTRAVAARQGAGATIETIERIVARVLASPQTISVEDGGPRRQWTSRELDEVEQRFLAAVDGPNGNAATTEAIASVVEQRPTLGDDQRTAVEVLSASTAPVGVLVGPAGTGKTFTVEAIREAHARSGLRVFGAAPSARAALELEAATGMPSSTLHRLLDNWNRGFVAPAPDSLLVIDEAGMADIRNLTTSVERQTQVGGRVLLVGDHRQLPEIGAGGGFASAALCSPAVVPLTVNRRQRNAWEHRALDELRHGSIRTAITHYLDHDRIEVAADPNALVDLAIERWAQARAAGLRPVMLAGTNDLVDRLNLAAIDYLVRSEALTDSPPAAYGAASFRPGERVLARRNSAVQTPDGDTLDIANGQPGTVRAATSDAITIAFDNGTTARLDDGYLKRGGHLTHAYARTTHRAQGGTWDLAIAVGADSLYREAAYVQLSRGSHSNQLIVSDPELTEILNEASTDTERHDRGHRETTDLGIDDHLAGRLTTSRAKHLAHTLDPDLDAVELLASTTSLPDLRRQLGAALAAERIATDIHGHTPDELINKKKRLVDLGERLVVGARVSPNDRNNVGTTTSLDESRGEATVQFVSLDGTHAERTFDWSELRLIDDAEPPAHTSPERRNTLTARLHDIDTTLERWSATVESLGGVPGHAGTLTAAISAKIQRSSNELRSAAPTWLHTLLGDRPVDVGGARAWDDSLRKVAVWRLDRDLRSDSPALGPAPSDPKVAEHWSELNSSLAQTRVWIDTTDRTLPAESSSRTHDELVARSDELDQILDTAPADCRNIINELRAGQLSLADTVELLDSAVAQQSARREWITEHWPHVVEYQEIDRALMIGEPPDLTSADRESRAFELEI